MICPGNILNEGNHRVSSTQGFPCRQIHFKQSTDFHQLQCYPSPLLKCNSFIQSCSPCAKFIHHGNRCNWWKHICVQPRIEPIKIPDIIFPTGFDQRPSLNQRIQCPSQYSQEASGFTHRYQRLSEKQQIRKHNQPSFEPKIKTPLEQRYILTSEQNCFQTAVIHSFELGAVEICVINTEKCYVEAEPIQEICVQNVPYEKFGKKLYQKKGGEVGYIKKGRKETDIRPAPETNIRSKPETNIRPKPETNMRPKTETSLIKVENREIAEPPKTKRDIPSQPNESKIKQNDYHVPASKPVVKEMKPTQKVSESNRPNITKRQSKQSKERVERKRDPKPRLERSVVRKTKDYRKDTKTIKKTPSIKKQQFGLTSSLKPKGIIKSLEENKKQNCKVSTAFGSSFDVENRKLLSGDQRIKFRYNTFESQLGGSQLCNKLKSFACINPNITCRNISYSSQPKVCPPTANYFKPGNNYINKNFYLCAPSSHNVPYFPNYFLCKPIKPNGPQCQSPLNNKYCTSVLKGPFLR